MACLHESGRSLDEEDSCRRPRLQAQIFRKPRLRLSQNIRLRHANLKSSPAEIAQSRVQGFNRHDVSVYGCSTPLAPLFLQILGDLGSMLEAPCSVRHIAKGRPLEPETSLLANTFPLSLPIRASSEKMDITVRGITEVH